MNQARIDDLTAQLKAGNQGVVEAITAEVAEVKAAIENPNINTDELEKAIQDNAKLKDAVDSIYTPPVTPGTDGETGNDGGSVEPGSTDTNTTGTETATVNPDATGTVTGDAGTTETFPADEGDANASRSPSDGRLV